MSFYDMKILFVLAFILPATTAFAAIEDEVIRRADQARDIKVKAAKPKGTWLPVPIPISNPTIGSGLQAAILYLHPKTSEDPGIPNSTSGVMGMYTDTKSWLVGGFHDGSWSEGRYRGRIAGGTGEFSLDYFGVGENSIFTDNPLPYQLRSDVFISQFLSRIPGTRSWFLGLRYMFVDSDVTFDIGNSFPGLPPISGDMTTSSLGLMTTFDTRDNNYYPTVGSYFELVWARDDEAWGSDFEFDKLTTFYNYYLSITTKDVLALRGVLADAGENTPFYLLPGLQMRGFPAGRYKDNSSLSGHVEWRRKFLPRWGFVVFGEAGSIAASMSELFHRQTITSYGGGLRWQVTKDKKINLGVDVGFSGDDKAIYVRIGEVF